jgi:hypothetical protein
VKDLAKSISILGIMLVIALVGFEIFNFDTTEFGFQYFFGARTFWGVQWATWLAMAAGMLDFAGIVDIFTPQKGLKEIVWITKGGWIIATILNAMLTWWTVALILSDHNGLGNNVLTSKQLMVVVPTLMAVFVWIMRFSLITTISVAGEHLIWNRRPAQRKQARGLPAFEPQKNGLPPGFLKDLSMGE